MAENYIAPVAAPDTAMTRSIVKIEARFENKITGHSIWKTGNGLLLGSDLVVAGGEVVYDTEYQLSTANRSNATSVIVDITRLRSNLDMDSALCSLPSGARIVPEECPTAQAVTHCCNCTGRQELLPEPVAEPTAEPFPEPVPKAEPKITVTVSVEPVDKFIIEEPALEEPKLELPVPTSQTECDYDIIRSMTHPTPQSPRNPQMQLIRSTKLSGPFTKLTIRPSTLNLPSLTTSVNESTKAFVKGLFEPTLPLPVREDSISSLGSVLRSAVSVAQQIVCQVGKSTIKSQVPKLLYKYQGADASAVDVQATRVLVQRAIMVDAAYQAISTLCKEKLQVLKVIPLDGTGPHDETLLDFIKRVIQRLSLVCLDDAKQTVRKFIPLLLNPSTHVPRTDVPTLQRPLASSLLSETILTAIKVP
ncbi:hypothetical protein FCIRC_8010 [Fusarium circinatum]|uniref:Uncharacterized protein n=1 Tax=Fusarium circinatum TaxID=48490 RepID=A0A8H5WS91_FUSCI|nr:hypothetical protein FCIRC_8010 [Fusarium circinatum]